MEQELLALGLTWNEVKVYKSLMKLGETQVGGVIADLKIHRQIAYNALDALEKRGMVAKTMKNKFQHYKIVDPEVIVENVRKQEALAERLARTIKHEMKKSRHENEINIYSGQAGAQKFYTYVYKKMPKGAETYIMGVSVKGHLNSLGEDFIRGTYNKLKTEKQIVGKLVMGESERNDNEEFGEKTNPKLRESRYLPYENSNPVSTTIWPDRITFMATGKDIFLIEIINQEFRDSYKAHFDMLWKMAKK
ncbi:MAG: helix-turn-helix domain-containing protein [Parcubacteria group bacterium]|jgi:sugar-specific transcriptional regulator TrmB